ncbi:MAG: anti-sigma factor antagonist [Ruminococcus sp.]|nr:anti-sigma factor antagonist [Candidatus Copronaster equi]
MAIVEFNKENNLLTLIFSGRIDSGNAAEVEKSVAEICDGNGYSDVVIDAENLEYISSAGLRVVLRLRKENPSLKIINVSSEVYEIFDMTGFTEMMPVEKAYRKLSVEGCEVIGQGANGKVYRLDPDTIIKVYLNPDSLPDIHRERELARRAFVLGIPTAIPYDVVKVGDGYGSVFELLNAKSFSKLINAEPDNIDKYVELYVDLLKKIHSTKVKPDDMPDMKDVAVGWAKFYKDYLDADKAEKLVKLVEAVPHKLTMMHGDYHLKNIMMQNGEVLLIDMDTLCYGHPIFELASMYNAYVGFFVLEPEKEGSFLGISPEASNRVWKESLKLYLGTDDEARLNEVEEKAKLMGYTRLARRLIRRGGLEDENGKAYIDHYIKTINELLDKIDTLEF